MIFRTLVFTLIFGLAVMESMAQSQRVVWRAYTEDNVVGGGAASFLTIQPGGYLADTYIVRRQDLYVGVWLYAEDNSLRLATIHKKVVSTLIAGFAHVSPLDEGTIVGPSSDWQDEEGCVQADCSRTPLIASASYTAWYGKTAYAGVHLIHKGQIHYGWIKLEVSADGQRATIKEAAFHLDGGQPVATGDRGRGILAGSAITQTGGALCFSITNRGRVGYVATGRYSEANSCPPTRDERRGIGIRYKERSLMYEGGLLLGVDESRVLSTTRGEGILYADEDLSQRSETGMHILRDGDTQYGRVELVDDYAEHPIGLSIVQESFSFGAGENEDFAILQYNITNQSPQDIENMFVGLWIDWDLGADVTKNEMDFDGDRKMGYAQISTGPSGPGSIAGIRVLTQNFPMIDSFAGDVGNLNLNVPGNLLTRRRKWAVISGAIQERYSFDKDIFQIATVGPIQIPAGRRATIAFALVAGDNLEDLKTNADRALAKYPDVAVSVERGASVPDLVTIGEVFPNPVTDQATFQYKLSRSAHVEVDVYDLLGRHVSRLLSTKKQAGEYTLTWHTDGAPVSSGVYTVRWTVNHSAHQERDSRLVVVR